MGSSSSAGNDGAEVRAVCARLLQCATLDVRRFAGGRNSQIYRIDCGEPAGVRPYVVKQYHSTPGDSRDRLDTEFRALQFLKTHGISPVPTPIAIDRAARCAIYEHVSGECAASRPTSADDVRQAVDFLIALQALSQVEGARDIADASEACFSFAAIGRSLDARLATLRAVPDEAPGSGALRRFLDERFDPLRAAIAVWCDALLRDDAALAEELPQRDRILSPSDFGLHNALRTANGRLVFVDFEYFGWDDPAKAIVDFLLHPGMDLTADRKRQFADAMVSRLPAQPRLVHRARLAYPLFGLKWCLILLNEFVPQYLRRRAFAEVATQPQASVLDRQLLQAERLVDRLEAEYRSNPVFPAP